MSDVTLLSAYCSSGMQKVNKTPTDMKPWLLESESRAGGKKKAG